MQAYCSDENWQKILSELELSNWNIRDNQYDAVFHMVTAADGAAEFYTTGNNVARWETPEQACLSVRGSRCFRVVGVAQWVSAAPFYNRI